PELERGDILRRRLKVNEILWKSYNEEQLPDTSSEEYPIDPFPEALKNGLLHPSDEFSSEKNRQTFDESNQEIQ
ncbi:hypothetical protein LOAG_11734, partial [Loa loa]